MNQIFKRTKILATIGPAVNSPEKIEEIIMSGVNGCRLNFSHGSYEERDAQIAWIRAAAEKKGRSVAILQDLQGPKIRLGNLKGNHLDVKTGDELILDYSLEEHDGGNFLPVQYNLAEKVKVGEPLSLFDGKIKASITEICSDTAIKIKIENDGYLMSHKGLNLPDTDFGGDIITEKDLADIEFGASRDFDYVAMSFIQTADDIDRLRQILVSHGSSAQIIAKIETKSAISAANLEGIVEAADGIMIARGDMAVEAGTEVVPIIQRKLVALCRKHSKLCIVATQMMASMVENPEPSRAEASDVANAVIQGADVVMLSDETANGKYPVEAVKAMKKIILYTQSNAEVTPLDTMVTGISETYDAISAAAAKLASELDADAIICETASGATAAAISAQRPVSPIIAVTSNTRVANQLALSYATSAFVRPYSADYGVALAEELYKSDFLKTARENGPLVIVVSGAAKNQIGGTDTIKVRQIIKE